MQKYAAVRRMLSARLKERYREGAYSNSNSNSSSNSGVDVTEQVVEFAESPLVSMGDLTLAHDAAYVNRFLNNELD